MTLQAFGNSIALLGTLVSFVPIAMTIHRVHSVYGVFSHEPSSADMKEMRRLFSALLRTDSPRRFDLGLLTIGFLMLLMSQVIELYLML